MHGRLGFYLCFFLVCVTVPGVCFIALAQAADDTSPGKAAQRFTTGNAESGKPHYKKYCSGCHGKDGRGGAHTFMPHIGKLTKKGYIELLPDDYLYLIIAEGGEAVGKNSYMPAWKKTLSEEQIKDVIAYIRSMPTY